MKKIKEEKFIKRVISTIGKLVKNERKKRRLSQQALALSAGISLTYLAKIESGKVNPSIKQLRKIVRVFKIKISTLLNDFDMLFNLNE